MSTPDFSRLILDQENWGQSVIDKLKTVPVPLGMEPKVDAIRKCARDLIRESQSPVKLGVVGEFSSGKSLTIGSLVGFGDLLPVSDEPTTGNITALRFVQAEDGAASGRQHGTWAGDYSIEFLSSDAVAECLEFMLEEASRRCVAAELEAEANQFRQLALRAKAPDIHRQIEDMIRVVWQDPKKNPSLRYLLRELIIFVRCDTALQVLRGHTWTVSAEVAKAGLQLNQPDRDIRSQTFETLPSAAPFLPMRPGPSEMTVDLLRQSFSLIHRCHRTVYVSRQVWDLHGVRGCNDFILLDFPGLGAENSGVRDRFLCFRELTHVQTILVLLLGLRSGSGGATELFTMMQRERTDDLDHCFLLGIGRFDEMPVDSSIREELLTLVRPTKAGASAEVDDLLDSPDDAAGTSRQLNDQDVLDRATTLNGLIKSAFAFTSKRDRIALLSSVLGLGRLAVEHPNLQVASDKFQRELRDKIPAAEKAGEFWGEIGRHLKQSRNSDLAGWLTDFGRDGGMSSLRQMIQSHVSEHGMRQLHARVQKLARDTYHEMHLCNDTLEQMKALPEPDSPVARARQALVRLIGRYNDFKHEYEDRPPQLEVRVPGHSQLRRVEELVHEKSIQSVTSWSEWTQLLNSVREGYIEALSDDQAEEARSLLPEMDGERGKAPELASDFLPAFCRTCWSINDYVHAQSEAGLARWLDHLTEKLRDIASRIGPFLEEVTAHGDVPPKYAGKFNNLMTAVKPVRLKANLVQKCLQGVIPATGSSAGQVERQGHSDGDANENPKWKNIFPLTSHRELAWHPQVVNGPAGRASVRQNRHQVQLQRLHQKFVGSASREFTAQVAAVTKDAVNRLRALFEELETRLRAMTDDREFVAWLAGEKPAENGEKEPDDLGSRLQELMNDAPRDVR